MPPYDKSIAKHMSSKYIKKINTVPKRLLNQVGVTQEMKENYRQNLMRSRTPIKRDVSRTPIKKKKKKVKEDKSKTPVRITTPTPIKERRGTIVKKSPINTRKSVYQHQ